jgi:hypothetical protein
VGVHELTGARPGPTIGISGGLHGDEPDTVEFVRSFIERMRHVSLAGTIVAIPCANPLAYESRTRNTPIDMMDLNRVFPGDPDGTLTAQLAAKIYAVFAGRCDFFVDVHSGGLFPAVEYAYIHGDAALARSAGLKLLYTGPSYNGSLALCLEVQILRPHHGGMLLSRLSLADLGSALPAGTEVATIVSPQTLEPLETLVTPFDPSYVILAREGFTPASPGDFGFIFGRAAPPAADS